MRIYDIAFYSAGFFLVGVFLWSLKLDFLLIVILAAFAAVLFLLIGFLFSKNRTFWLAGLSLIIVLGAFYSGFYDFLQKESLSIAFGKKIDFSGVVIKDPERGEAQQLTIELQEPYSGNILAKLQPYPAMNYGDLINFEGVINEPQPQGYADYLAKNHIFGVSNPSKIQLVSSGNGSFVRAVLFGFKNRIIAGFQKVLPQQTAAFLAGLTLGEQGEFSPEFKDEMAKSGTTHLVALSGYNISIIVLAVSGLMVYFFSRRLTFLLTAIIIVGFVLMTGAEASVVRAAIMGFLAMLAVQASRIYDSRNIITLTAFFMILINPKVLRFDAGFQLSFLALLGIVYLSPAIRNFFKMKQERGFLGWRENFLTTTSAQLAVVPLLILNFGRFTPISLLANILILELIPVTMSLGFLVAGLTFTWGTLAQILAWFTGLFLNCELFLIKFFSGFNLYFAEIGIGLAIIYYALLTGFIVYNYKQDVAQF